jgi:hypothetical protein
LDRCSQFRDIHGPREGSCGDGEESFYAHPLSAGINHVWVQLQNRGVRERRHLGIFDVERAQRFPELSFKHEIGACPVPPF